MIPPFAIWAPLFLTYHRRDLEFLQPNKTDVLPFIAGHSATPDRYARATIIFRATEVPYIEDYMVGPLPVTPDTQVRPLDYVYNRKSTKVPLPVVDVEAVEKFNHEAAMTIAEITTSLWNKVGIFKKDSVFIYIICVANSSRPPTMG